ncbi:serine/threonine protein kinase [Thermocoleostomius sinensis]|uniref:Serine/threonine-protein kinase n=1 Tax=Thermocoleostomius sinensis A174 TaxID=2016057 RepID=A0A9E9C8P6_9CYAN|nr:serine/threonine-protein kinase [Thermocoleostomius sinensis]WAL58667.1 serine/threonine-protein kinase [Thermocoleostomius sinensis A174]
MAWASGQKLQEGKYRIESVLGVGGFGITYLARDNLGNLVVIKTLNDTALQDPRFKQFQQDFVNEAVRLAKCAHPHIVQVHRVFEESGLWCMVMDYIAGEDLSSRVKQRGILSEAEALHYVRQIGDALSLVHQQGLLHRDVKPENIMLRAGRAEAVLLDLGIAREFTPNSTQVHTAILSNGYAPIEQYEAQARRGAYSDVYGLAATLYFMLTGEIPKDAQIRAYNLLRYHSDPLDPPQQLNASISDRTNQAILQGMAVEAHDRPQSVTAWLEMLPTIGFSASAPRIFIQPNASVTPQVPPFTASASAPTRPEVAPRSNFATVAVQAPPVVTPSQPATLNRSPIPRFVIAASVITASVLVGSAAAIWYVQQQARSDLASVAQLRDERQYEECLNRAAAVKRAQPTYEEAQVLLNQCAEGILTQANQLAANGQLPEALQAVAKIPPDTTAGQTAQDLMQQWSDQLLQQATRLYQNDGKLTEAINLVRAIPTTTAAGAQAEDTIQRWQAEWKTNESTLQAATDALEARDWYAAKEKAATLTTPYWIEQGEDITAEADAEIAAMEAERQRQEAAQEAEQQDPDAVFLQAYEQCLATGGQDCQQFEQLCRERGGVFVADATYLDCRPGVESNKSPKSPPDTQSPPDTPEEVAPPDNSRRPRQLIIPGDR